MQTIDEALEKLQASPFRAKFRLSERERAYICLLYTSDAADD